jgi:hypothetical protein
MGQALGASSTTGGQARGGERRGRRVAAALLFGLVPLVGVAELVAGERQRAAVPSWSDWTRAADAAKAARKPGDAVIVAPRWASSIGRMALDAQRIVPGKRLDDAIDVKLLARSDLETYPRAIELSIRGKDDPDVKGWRLVSERKFGQVSVRTLENPSPQRLIRDLADEIDATATVYRVSSLGAHDPCRWEAGAGQGMVALGNGPRPPADRWLCSPWDPSWTTVGTTVITDLDFTPRRCIWMHPNGDLITTIELPARPIGRKVVGHVGLHVFQERELKGAPIFARVTIGGRKITEVRHVDGDGWLRFEAATPDLAGQQLPVKLELWVEGGKANFRPACMAVELRE